MKYPVNTYKETVAPFDGSTFDEKSLKKPAHSDIIISVSRADFT
jgi:hypothetical protein